MSEAKSSMRRSKRKSHARPKQPNSTPNVATFFLKAGCNVEIRSNGERKWQPHRIRRSVEMRTVKRIRDTLYMEYLGFEVRYTDKRLVTEKRFKRY